MSEEVLHVPSVSGRTSGVWTMKADPFLNDECWGGDALDESTEGIGLLPSRYETD